RAYVDKMIELIEELVTKGHAYVADGDVYFSVRSFPDYGKLSGKSLDDLRAGARVEPGESKRDPLDFALWKAAKPGEPKWPSPWGPGRPGWHTECVVMSRELLGETLDIHAGGNDLIFPHHENEIAQAEAISGKPFARIWLHNGMLTVKGEKMSKSLGNFYYARDIVELYGTEAVRYFYLSRHWRKPLNFSHEALEEARKAVEGVYEFLINIEIAGGEIVPPEEFSKQLASLRIKFEEELEDDFNTAGALASLQEMVNLARRYEAAGLERRALFGVARLIRQLSKPLGLFQKERAPSLSKRTEELIGLLVELRSALRKERNFSLADAIREKLAALGVELKDTPQGTVWTLK
ncbi:cysteine--tRNA ligase, partial [Candidatus Bipolaricaulota bacterium]|nr:cysteine--tRNA ligase [Candidatus Bipolaricaulota bacterium]